MPQPALDGVEVLQTLVAIRQNLEPLITKRILDDTHNITSLAVSNSRSFFKFELDRMFLCLKKDQDLLPLEYTHFPDDLLRLFQLLEELIDEQVLRPVTALNQDHSNLLYGKRTEDLTAAQDLQRNVSVPPGVTTSDASTDERSSTTGYPKLEALMKRVSDDSTSSDLSTLLRLPETKEECEEAEQALTTFNKAIDYNIKDIGFINESYDGPLTKSITRPELESVKQSQKRLSNLLNAMKNNITNSECHDIHIAKLQIRDPEGSSDSIDGVQYKIFVSCSLAQDKWQETACKVVPQLPPPSLDLKNIRNICKAIKNSIDNQRILEILVHTNQILHSMTRTKLIKFPPIWPTVSLECILSSHQDHFKPLDKVILALNLSRALLRIYSVEMENSEWTAENIYFLFNPLKQTVYEAYNPYLAYSLLQSQRCENAELARSRKFSVLISFAKLLLEIAVGRTLGTFSRRQDIALLELTEESEVTDNVVKGYVDAVTVCLEANKRKNDDYDEDDGENSEDEGQPLEEESQCRTVIFAAVAHLEEARTQSFSSPKGPNYPLELKVSNAVQNQSSSKSLNHSAARNLESSSLEFLPSNRTTSKGAAQLTVPRDMYPGSCKQLFDVRKSLSDSRSDGASSFLHRAEEFYTNNIEQLSNKQKIRIAILDTGVDQNNGIFRGVRWRRLAKDSPFKKIRSFIEDSNTADTFGHGTNVASLVLKVAPEADLYIAKISQGQEEEAVEPVVKAIKWATDCNVHIISMSFAFVENHPAIKKAIEIGENEGVVFFAAASNYGGNTPRLFPAKLDKVLCIHASDGHGNKSGMDPSPKPLSENFSTLGVAIPSVWEDGVYLSGTSYSTPIAAGIAANVLRFIQHVTDAGMLTEEQRNEAFSRSGVKNILLKMAETRDNYQYITPWRSMWNEDTTIQDVVTKIKEALKE